MYVTGLLIWLWIVFIITIAIPTLFFIYEATKAFMNRKDIKQSVYMKFMIGTIDNDAMDSDELFATYVGIFILLGALLSLVWPLAMTIGTYIGVLYLIRYMKEKK